MFRQDERSCPTPFCSDRTWVFPVTPERFWEVVSRTGDFRRWWPWLRELEADGLVEGGRAHCLVRAPVPYALCLSIEIRRVVPGRLVEAQVGGDLEGPARLEVAPHPGGTAVRLAWELGPRRPLLRAATRLTRPVMQWGHDWVVTNGVEEFRRRALG